MKRLPQVGTRRGKRRSTSWNVLVSALVAALGLGACDSASSETTRSEPSSKVPKTRPPAARAQADTSPRAPEAAQAFGRPLPLLELPLSAYGPRLTFDEQDMVLLTAHAVYRLSLGKPLEKVEIELGHHSLLTQHFLVYWKEGRFYRATKRGTEAKAWLSEKDEPAEMLGVGDDLVYSHRNAAGRFSIRLARKTKSRIIYETAHALSGLAAIDGALFFVERDGASWRLGALALEGGSPRYSAPRVTRPPALLQASEDAIIYYEGLGRGVRRVTPDFVRDDPIDADLICSPLYVKRRVYCASVGGVGVLPLEGGPRQWLARSLPGPLAAIAASDTHIAWLIDSGREHLTLEAVEFDANKY